MTAGQVVIKLEDVQPRTKVDQAKQAAEALETQVQAAHPTLAVLKVEVS